MRAPLEPPSKLRLFLEGLKSHDSGKARIVNLLDGLAGQHVSPEHVRAVVTAASYPGSDFWQVYESLLDRIRQLHGAVFFKRPNPPAWDRPIALVLENSLFDRAEGFRLFSDHYIAQAKSLGRVRERITDVYELDDMLQYIRDGLREGIASNGLGAPGRVVFMTRVDETWEELTKRRFPEKNDGLPSSADADEVCDYLGLPYRNTWLVELRSRVNLSELVEQGALVLAAPTVIEAWGFDFFRHWPREGRDDRWGRTLNVGIRDANREGLPEAIVDRMPATLLSEAFDVSILGYATARPVPSPDDIAGFLIGNRELDALVSDILARVP